jgi:hypothetical protein
MGVAASILEGLDEMPTVNRLGLPTSLRRSLACTNSIENMMGTVRRVCRNVKRWRNAPMALRWTAAGMMEATKGFRRLKAYRYLPILRAALVAHVSKDVVTKKIEPQADAAQHHSQQCLSHRIQQNAGHPPIEWSDLKLASRSTDMPRKSYKPDEIVAKLRQVDVLTAGVTVLRKYIGLKNPIEPEGTFDMSFLPKKKGS